MSFSNSAADLSQIIALTTFLGDADNLLRVQTTAQTTYDLEDVKVATVTVLPGSPSYITGALGVGAYLQATSYLSGSGKLSIDTIVMEPGFRVLVKNQATAAHNGVYKVTSEGGVSTYYRLTRVEDFDESVEIKNYTKINVLSGSQNEIKTFFLESGGAPTVGSTSLVFSEFPQDATAAFLIAEFRKQLDAKKTEAEFDNARTLISTARNVEVNLPVSLNSQFSSICTGLNTFYFSQYGEFFRTYFADAYSTGDYSTDNVSPLPVWTDNFRTLWRNTINQELVVRLGTVQKAAGSSGAWGAFTADKSVELNTAMLIKIKSDLEVADVPVGIENMPITLTVLDADGNSYVSTVNIPVGSLAGDTFPITTTFRSTFAEIQDVTISNLYGGTGEPIVEFWVSL